MAVVRERIILRKGRRSGEKMPHRIDIKELAEGDSLLVEIVIDRLCKTKRVSSETGYSF